MIEAEIAAGQLLAGKYLVERVIGRGGMGAVVAALHPQLNERVAIKVLSHVSEDAIGRFRREARVAARIRSEYVAHVMDMGELESGAPYIVMEYLEGEDLSAFLKRNGRLTVDEAIDFVLQACVALADAHLLGVVHRDLKPANLFCTRRSDGRRVIKVLDFGISKLIDATRPADLDGTPITLTATTMGTPLYMSPEQMRSAKAVDVRTDIWALGIVLFELLAGEPPFRGESFADVAVKVASDPLPALSSYRSDLPRGLEGVVRRCLEKDRERRFANIAELAHALASFAPKRAVSLVERIASISRGEALTESEAPQPSVDPAEEPRAGDDATRVARVIQGTMAPWAAPGPAPSRANSKRLLLAAAAVGLAAVMSVGARQLLQGSNSPIPSATPHAAMPAPLSVEKASSPEAASSPPPMQVAPAAPSALLLLSASRDPEPTEPRPPPRDRARAPVVPPKPLAQDLHASPQPAASGGHASSSVGAYPSSDCNPPYTIDEQGRKHFKRQCYQNARR
jgi:serine/threonine protein kinase